MITITEAIVAAGRLGVLRYYPAGEIAQVEIADVLFRMVGDKDQLNWLVRAMIDQVGEWKGPRELRAVFCTRYRPVDGIEQWSETPGFTAADSERAHMEQLAPEKRAEIEAPRSGDGLVKIRELYT